MLYNTNQFNPTEFFPPSFYEKKAVRRTANRIGFAVLAMFAVMTGWSFAYFKITTVLGITTEKALALTKEPMFIQALQVVLSLIMSLLPFAVLLKSMYIKAERIILFKKPEKGLSAGFIFGGVGYCLFASSAASAAGAIFENFGISFPEPENDLPTGILGFLMVIITTALLPALVEEFAIRGVVLGLLRPFGDGFAIICSSLVFGFMHAAFLQIPFAFLVGLLLAVVTVKANSIWPAVAIHATNNLLSVLFSYMYLYYEEDIVNSVYLVVMCVSFIVSAVILVAILKRNGEAFKIPPANTAAAEKKKIMWFITSPAVLVSFLAALAIAYFLR